MDKTRLGKVVDDKLQDLNHLEVVVILTLIIIASTILSKTVYAPCDDAYIFFVYVKNLLTGNGLTYNGREVWGFTSPLWVGLVSLVSLLRVPIHHTGEILSTISGWFALWATYHLARSLGLTRSRSLFPPLLLGWTGDFVFYSSVGLEIVLFSGSIAVTMAFVFNAKYSQKKGLLKLALLMVAMILIRPEGVLFAGCLLVLLILQTQSIRDALLVGLIIVFIMTPIIVIFYLYYGDWLPNTYYVKSNAGFANLSHGIHYLWSSLPRYSPIIALGAIFLIIGLIKQGISFKLDYWLLLISGMWVGYITVQGGDNMVGGRMWIPILPMAFVAFISCLYQIPKKLLFVFTLAFCSILFFAYYFDASITSHRNSWQKSYTIRKKAGQYLRDQYSPKTIVALSPAGIIPYYSELPTIDMLGLNNRYIARYGKRNYSLPYGHQAGDGHYVLSQKPDIILFGGSLYKKPRNYISEQEIWALNLFHENYTSVEWPGIGTAYVRKEMISSR